MFGMSRKAQEHISMAILGIVAVLAVVGLVMLFKGGTTGQQVARLQPGGLQCDSQGPQGQPCGNCVAGQRFITIPCDGGGGDGACPEGCICDFDNNCVPSVPGARCPPQPCGGVF